MVVAVRVVLAAATFVVAGWNTIVIASRLEFAPSAGARTAFLTTSPVEATVNTKSVESVSGTRRRCHGMVTHTAEPGADEGWIVVVVALKLMRARWRPSWYAEGHGAALESARVAASNSNNVAMDVAPVDVPPTTILRPIGGWCV